MERIFFTRREVLKMIGVATLAVLTAPNSTIIASDGIDGRAGSAEKNRSHSNIVPQIATQATEPEHNGQGISGGQEFIYGKDRFNLASPFKVTLSNELGNYLGRGPSGSYHMDIPLPLATDSWDSAAEIMKTMETGAGDNSAGNPFVLTKTDIPNLSFVLSHSGIRSSIGEAARKAGTMVINGTADKLWDLTADFNFADNPKTLKGSVEGTVVIDAETFSEKNSNGEPTWGYYKDQTALFARTDKMGIPDSVRTNDPNKFIVGFVSCIANDGKVHYAGFDLSSGKVKLDVEKNSTHRSILFMSFDANQ